jgi:membrane-associated phospholipid phosphatase
MCGVIFGASVLALVLPERRRRLQNVALFSGFLIVAWVVMAAVILAGLAWAADSLEG